MRQFQIPKLWCSILAAEYIKRSKAGKESLTSIVTVSGSTAPVVQDRFRATWIARLCEPHYTTAGPALLFVATVGAVYEGVNELTGGGLALLSQEGSVIETLVEITRGEVPKPHA